MRDLENRGLNEDNEMELNVLHDQTRLKLLATPEIREAIDNISLERQYINAGKLIIQYLDKCLSVASTTEDEDEESHEIANIMYVLKRVMGALSSDRNYSRHGGYSILFLILKSHPKLFPHVLMSIKSFYGGDGKGRNSFVGHTLANGALIRSGHAEQDSILVDEILKQFLQANSKASYMDPLVGQFIICLIKTKREDIVNQVYEKLRVALNAPVNELKMALLWVRIVLSRPEFQKYLDTPEKFDKQIYCFESYGFILNEIWNWHNRDIDVFPFVQDFIDSMILYDGEKTGADNVIEFYALNFIPSYKKYETRNTHANSFKRFIFTLSITQMIMPHLVKGYQVSAVIVGYLIRQIIKYCVSDDPTVKSYAHGFCDAIAKEIESNKDNGEVQLAYISQIITHPGNVRFDKVTGTSLLRSSYQYLNVSCIQGLASLLHKHITHDKYEVSEGVKGQLLFSGDLMMAAEFLSQLVQHPAVASKEHTVWRAEQVYYFLKNAFFRNHPEREKELLLTMYKKCLDTSSKHLSDQITFIDVIVEKIDADLSQKNSKCPLSIVARKARSKLGLKMKKMKERHGDDKEFAVFRLLYGLLSLHLFIDSKSSLDIISDIDHCYKEVVEIKEKEENVTREVGFGHEEEWVKVFVDVMLLLLSKGDHYWRNVVTSIFRVQCHMLGPLSLSLLTDVIDPDKEEEVFNKEEDEKDVEMDDGDDDSNSSDDNEDEEESDDDDDDNDDNEDEDMISEDDNEDEPETDEKLSLKMKMHNVIGLGENDINIDDMSEEEMNRVDKSLGALFLQYQKLNKRVKPKLKIDKELLLQFRMRVCDLFSGLISEAPSVSHMIALISPLLRVLDWSLRDKLQNNLRGRVRTLIHELCKVKEFKLDDNVDIDDITSAMDNVFNICVRTPITINPELQICYTFLVKHGLRSLGEKSDDTNNEVIKAYIKHLKCMLSKKKWVTHFMVLSGPLSLESGSLLVSFKVLSQIGFDSKCKSATLFVLLKTLWMNRNSLGRMPNAEVKTLQEETSKQIAEFFLSINVKNLHAKRTVAMFELVQEIYKFHNHCPGMTAGFDWTAVFNSIKNLYSKITRQSHPGVYKKIITLRNFTKIDLENIELTGEKPTSRKEILLAKRKRHEERRLAREEKKSKKNKRNEEDIDEDKDDEEGGEDEDSDEENEEEPLSKKSKSDDESSKEKKKKKKEEKRKRKREIEDNRLNALGETDLLEDFSFAKFDNINIEDEE